MTKKTVDKYCTLYKEASTQLRAWYYEVKNAQWNTPLEVKEKYRTASIIGGTHKEYNKINVEEL